MKWISHIVCKSLIGLRHHIPSSWNSTITCRFQIVQVYHGNFHPFERHLYIITLLQSRISQLPVDFKLFKYITETSTPSKVKFHSNLSISICSGISRKLPPLRKWNSTVTCRFQTDQLSHKTFYPFESGIPQLPVDFKLFRYIRRTSTPSKSHFPCMKLDP